MSLNVVTLVGRVGSDPDMKYFESGSVKCRMTLAVRRPTSKSDEPDWFTLELWGRTAETAKNYVQKGSLIGVKGSLKIDKWSDSKTGTNRSIPIIHVEKMDLLGSKRDVDSNFAGGTEGY